jgi:hypothetical protein
MIRDNRSMNADLARGAVDGKIRFLRPDSVDADEQAASERAGALHTQHYGSMGISAYNAGTIAAHQPTPRTEFLPYLGE